MDIIAQNQMTKSAGKIADIEAKVEAKQIETAAASREADRKEDLARAIASQSAGAGASGLTLQGSPLSVLEEDVRQEGIAGRRDTFQAKLAAQASRTRGKVAKKSARSQANLTSFKQLADRAASAGGA